MDIKKPIIDKEEIEIYEKPSILAELVCIALMLIVLSVLFIAISFI